MTLAHSARRGLATAAGGLVVVGAGASTGIIVAGMNATWNDQAALEAAATIAAQRADIIPARPVVVTLIEERHVTPEPVIVRKKVYRTRVVTGSGGATQPAAHSRPSTSRKATTGSSKPQTPQPKPAKPRTVVAPAPQAPAPASGGTGSGTTSKTS